jgi:hypothetical protein
VKHGERNTEIGTQRGTQRKNTEREMNTKTGIQRLGHRNWDTERGTQRL